MCLTTKAIHLELASDLSSEDFLKAFRRFLARRGNCSHIFSDNGTNCKGAARIINYMNKLLRSRSHTEFVSQELFYFGGI